MSRAPSVARAIVVHLSCTLAMLAPITPASAHQPGASYLEVELEGARAQVRWDIALRDLHYALGLDRDGDGAITWGELRGRHPAIAGLALAGLRIAAGERTCATGLVRHLVEHRGDGGYAVLRFTADCGARGPDTLEYRLFATLDPSHRGLARIAANGRVTSAVLGPDRPALSLAAGARPWTAVATDYAREGVRHVWLGIDHLAFLVTLLLPAVLLRAGRDWVPRSGGRAVAIDAVAVVTAFTVAHSITLGAAVLADVSLPARPVEVAIAATVIVAALNNLVPFAPARRWLLAFALGLVHGLGFAGALAELGLPAGARLLALAAFNLGVEAGQLAVVAVLLPALYLLRRRPLYRPLVLGLGSAAVALLGGGWLVERAFDLQVWPV